MGVTKRSFGRTEEGQEIILYSLQNKNGMIAEVMNYGAILVNLFVPDKNGTVEDIVLGYDKAEEYFVNGSFFGATVGPNANRIADASFTIDGHKYQLAANDNANNLHSDAKLGYHKRLWNGEAKDCEVVFTLTDTDGCMGFPGNKKVQVTYTVTDENELKISYDASSDKKTVINMTNHSYFNLAGHKSGLVYQHQMCIHASHFTPVVAGAIPTGEIAAVAGTPFDFTKPVEIGAHIEDDCEQLKLVQGFDHNWVVDHYTGQMQEIAVVAEPVKGRTMTVYTDQPGVQFYAGNCITPQTGKEGASYEPRSGFCLETQVFPNSANQENFPDTIYGPDKEYHTATTFKFTW